MLNWQEKKKAESENAESDSLLRIGIVESDTAAGVRVRFAGEETAGAKRYPRNLSIALAVGDRVLLGKVAGSYVVICRF